MHCPSADTAVKQVLQGNTAIEQNNGDSTGNAGWNEPWDALTTECGTKMGKQEQSVHKEQLRRSE